ncbi:hydroxyisourate hydrolase [Lentilitoribacter sp. Alg239-R112]|uniref:hydroxyisourate hydrolase n=1 Tax=Lentilitoribacter sp. Alg239-R112 TaxID=2305987 RepID=UPI0013A68EE7|nr:hydroxyisourate hydrolase [Lentilitoribacter sp. Alg239-R112]
MSAEQNTGRLTTHVLDTASGNPAASLVIKLSKIDGTDRTEIKTVTTNSDGRCNAPLLEGGAMQTGVYELEFDVGGYFGNTQSNAFLTTVPVRFRISDVNSHYHVPLLVSPFGYSTYKGS